MNQLSKERISAIIEKWYMLEPLYFALWTTHELHIEPQIASLRSGGGRIEYNPEFIQSLDDRMLEEVLRFEAMRLLLKHPYQRRKPQPKISYQASNITVQEYLDSPLPIANARQTFGNEDCNQLYFERYYQMLVEDENGAAVSGSEGEGENDGDDSSGGAGAATDEGSEEKNEDGLQNYASAGAEENTETWEENEFFSQKINEKIEFAEQNRQWGNIPGAIQGLILATLKPKLNYKDMLKSFRASILSSKRSLTRMKPSRRYGFAYMGSRRDFCTKLLVAVDVSGSISDRDVQCAFSVINQLFKYGMETIDVIQFDTEIKGEPMQLKKARHKVEVKGRGGTDFQAPLDYIDKHRQYDGLIIFTDGYAPSPKPPQNRRTSLFWLFNHQDNYLHSKVGLLHLGRAGFVLD